MSKRLLVFIANIPERMTEQSDILEAFIWIFPILN